MTSADIARLDVPLDVLTAHLNTTAAADVLREAAERTYSPSDQIAYAIDLALLAHPERCSTNADYPNWTPGRVA